MNPLHPFARSSENALHCTENPSMVRTGVLLVVTNSLIFRFFCNRGTATSTQTAWATGGVDVEGARFLLEFVPPR